MEHEQATVIFKLF